MSLKYTNEISRKLNTQLNAVKEEEGFNFDTAEVSARLLAASAPYLSRLSTGNPAEQPSAEYVAGHVIASGFNLFKDNDDIRMALITAVARQIDEFDPDLPLTAGSFADREIFLQISILFAEAVNSLPEIDA